MTVVVVYVLCSERNIHANDCTCVVVGNTRAAYFSFIRLVNITSDGDTGHSVTPADVHYRYTPATPLGYVEVTLSA